MMLLVIIEVLNGGLAGKPLVWYLVYGNFITSTQTSVGLRHEGTGWDATSYSKHGGLWQATLRSCLFLNKNVGGHGSTTNPALLANKMIPLHPRPSDTQWQVIGSQTEHI